MTETIHSPPPEVPVLCYPNSGSSLIAGVLHHLGINMGDSLKQGQRINPKGLFEDEAFSNILGKIWFIYNSSPGYRRRVDQERLLSIGKRYKQELAFLLGQRQQGVAWGVKEPRMSLLWPLLTEYLKNPHWIIAGRDLDRMTRSRHTKLKKRVSRHRMENIAYYIKKGHYFTILSYLTNSLRFMNVRENELRDVIAHYYNLLDEMVSGHPCLKVEYEDLTRQPEKGIESIIRFLSIRPDQHQIDAALAFVSPELRHY